MIKNVKVSLSAVKRFEQSVIAVRDYTPQFDKGIFCFRDFLRFLSEQINVMRKSIGDMESARNRLAGKIKKMEAEIARLTAMRNNLEDKLASLENSLASTTESITITKEEGESFEVPNPEYTELEIKIAAVESEISAVNAQLFPMQQRLEHMNTTDRQLLSQIDSINIVIYSLQEKQNLCKQFKAELEEIKNLNHRNGTSASESLSRIEEIISDYQRIKMIYESVFLQDQSVTVSGGGVNTNINISKTVVNENTDEPETASDNVMAEEADIRRHQIRFDNNGRISEYDNKTFGGKYNSYETRLLRSPADDNPILGRYEGERGESKYIPSGRTVEGVVVIGILKEYGIDGIEYRNAEPDFEVCSEAVVRIKAMSENRENYSDSNGIPAMGNFSQADIECAKLWNRQKRGGRDDWNGRDVIEYRKENGLTWHEKCDTDTMVLVRSEINLYFRHSGGCSECRMRDHAQDGGGFDE